MTYPTFDISGSTLIYQRIPDGTDQLTLEIYAQLLDHYICDLELGAAAFKIYQDQPATPPNPWPVVRPQYPWDNPPVYYGSYVW